MPSVVAAVILLSYASLAVELTILRVPSVASSLRIWSPNRQLVATYSPQYRRLFELAKPVKLLLFFAPLLIVYGLYLYPLLVIWLGPDLLDDYLYQPALAADIAGMALITAGRGIALSSVLTIRRENDQAGESFFLHTSGIFRWSRNPGLVGMYLFVIGMWITMPSASFLAGLVVYAAHMDFKVRMEEDFLENRFGEPYVEYRHRTGRYLR